MWQENTRSYSLLPVLRRISDPTVATVIEPDCATIGGSAGGYRCGSNADDAAGRHASHIATFIDSDIYSTTDPIATSAEGDTYSNTNPNVASTDSDAHNHIDAGVLTLANGNHWGNMYWNCERDSDQGDANQQTTGG